MGGGYMPNTFTQTLGALSVLLAFVNVSGGFVITKRMLDMFKRKYTVSVFALPDGHPLTRYFYKDRLIHLSILCCTLYPPFCLVADTSPLQQQEWRDSFKLATLSAVSYA